MSIIIATLILCVIFCAGVIFHWLITRSSKEPVGIIKVSKDGNMTTFSLELSQDPSLLEFMNEVTFLVKTSGKS